MVKKSQTYRRSNFTKFVLYPFAVLFFLFAFTVIVLLANGYRFNYKNQRIIIEKTGIIIISSRPNDSDVFLDNKYTGRKTSFSFLTTRVNDLLPGKYMVSLRKEGFRIWQKEAEVKANLVTWLNYAILFPNELKIEGVSSLKDAKILAESKNKRTLLVSSKTIDGTILNISDYDGNLTKVWPKNYTPLEEWLKQPDVINASFNSNNEIILIKVKNGNAFDFALLDVPADGKITSLSGLKLPFTKIEWNPNNSNEIFALANGILYRINLDNLNPQEIASNIIDFMPERNGQIYYITENEAKTTVLNQMGFDGGRKTNIVKAIPKSSAYKISFSPQLDALGVLPLEEKTLTIYYKLNNQQSTMDLAKGVNSYEWGENGKRLYYYGDNFLNRFDWEKQEEIHNTITNIKKVSWYFDDFHFAVLTNEGLSVIDFDGLNKVEFSKSNVENFFLDPKLSSFIFTKNGNDKVENFKYSATF